MATIINSLFGVFATILLGRVMQRCNLTIPDFYRTSDKLVYFIFFPLMLFWKLGNPTYGDIEWHLGLSAILAVFAVWALSIVFSRVAGVPCQAVGSFSQACYRFNTYVGLPVVLSAFGDEGVRHFGVIIGTAIPFINILAVFTLVWFSDRSYLPQEKGRWVVKSALLNPLILACFSGLLYSKLRTPFPAFVDSTFRLLSSVALPLALLSIGSSLSLSKLRGHFPLAMMSSLFKILILPVAGYVLMRSLGVSALPFKVGMVYFALPTSTANYILSSQLDSDVDLASATIVLSTLLSLLSLPVALFLFSP